MCKKQEILSKINSIKTVIEQNGGLVPRFFGSFITDQFNDTSDLDILINLKPEKGLLEIIAIKQELEDLLNIRVDVITERSINHLLKSDILESARSI